MYKLCFYVPASHLEQVKDALFDSGAGKFKCYDRCCWQTLGEGQFRPLPGSRPFIGVANKLQKTAEFKVEMICEQAKLKDALESLLKAHPYQQPAYEIYKILSLDELV